MECSFRKDSSSFHNSNMEWDSGIPPFGTPKWAHLGPHLGPLPGGQYHMDHLGSLSLTAEPVSYPQICSRWGAR